MTSPEVPTRTILRRQLQALGWEVLDIVLALLISAHLVSGVSINGEGLIVATAIAVIPTHVVSTAAKRRGVRSGWRSVAGWLVIAWWAVAVPLADAASSGFNINSRAATVETILIVYAAFATSVAADMMVTGWRPWRGPRV